jgi:hypothetical protein
MALVIPFRIVRITVSTSNAVTSGCTAFVAEVLSAIFALINPHPRTAETIRIVTTVRTSCHYISPDFVLLPDYEQAVGKFKLNHP